MNDRIRDTRPLSNNYFQALMFSISLLGGEVSAICSKMPIIDLQQVANPFFFMTRSTNVTPGKFLLGGCVQLSVDEFRYFFSPENSYSDVAVWCCE